MKKSSLGIVILCLSYLFVGACSRNTYSGESIDATVVDDSTGEPLQDVAVVAYWELHGGSITGDSLPCGAANVEEAVTDKDGKFHIPAWGPLKGNCEMIDGYPFVYVFKPSYEYLGLSNRTTTARPVSVSRSDWNGQTIRLKRFPDMDLTKNGPSSYAGSINGLSTTLNIFIINYPKECNWKKIPTMLRLIDSQEKELKAAGNDISTITTDLVSNDEFLKRAAPWCGSPKSFIEGLGN